MKQLLLSIFISISFSVATAGNGGGTMKAAMVAASQGGTGGGGVVTREAIYTLEKLPQSVRLAYGQVINQKWNVQIIEVPVQDLDLEDLKLVEQSEAAREWVERR